MTRIWKILTINLLVSAILMLPAIGMATDFELFWDPNCNADANLKGYYIYYKNDASVVDDPSGAIDVYVALTDIDFDPDNPGYLVTGLLDDVRYCFSVTAWYGDEESGMSNEICGANGILTNPGSDPEPDPVTDPEPDPVTDPEPDPVTDPEPDPVTDPEPDPVTEPSPDINGSPLSKTGWTLVYADSEELEAEDGAATNAFDGDPRTKWHTKWRGSSDPVHPHEIIIDLGDTYYLDGFSYQPVQVNGRIIDYEFFVGISGNGPWTTPVASGAFANDRSIKSVSFAVATGRYIRLVAYSESNGNPWTHVGEIGVNGVPSIPVGIPITPPDGVIDSPATNRSIQVGESINFSGTGSDPGGDTSLAYRWQFGAGSGISDYTIDDSPGEIFFDSAGAFTVTFTVTNSGGVADPTPDTRVITVLEPSSDINGSPLSKTGWTLVYADSEELEAEDGAATNAFDGDPRTKWHTKWRGSSDPVHPHEIIIDLGDTYYLDGFSYQPVQVNGRIIDYEFFVGTSGSGPWTTPVASGAFANDRSIKSVSFAVATGRYIRLVAYSEPNGNPWTHVGEIGVNGVPISPITPPDGVIDSPAINQTIQVGESINFSGTGSDPSGDTSLAYRWQFGAGSGISDYTIDDSPGEIFFDSAGAFTVTFTVTNSEGVADPTPDTRVITVLEPIPDINGSPLSKTGWTLVYADSEELEAEDGAATNAFDGDPRTKWHTKWRGSSDPVHPHEIIIDLGDTYYLDGFSYQPVQVNGRIIDYEFFVGTSGSGPWTTPVASGAFANDRSIKSVSFAVTVGRYIRLVAYSEPNGNPWTHAGEIGVTGAPCYP